MQRFLLLWLLTSLAACSSTGSKPPLIDDHWRLLGKLGIRTEDARHSARVNWQQQGNNYQIQLSGPFGAGAVKLARDDNGVTLQQSGHATQHAPSANELLQDNLGWSLPVAAASYWVRALPAPGIDAQLQHDTDGRISQITQLGWQFNYRYKDAQPYRITLTPLAYNATLTLIIKQWQTIPSPH